jgi:hypothetical protein
MKISCRIAASVVFAGLTAVGVGVASPASADEFAGTYNVDLGAGTTATWNVTPCDNDPVNHCVHVTQTGDSLQQPWSADAFWQVGYWTLVVNRPDFLACPDGTKHSADATYSWNAATLEGQASAFNPGLCGGKPQTLAAPFTMTKVS